MPETPQIDAHISFLWSSGVRRAPTDFAGESNDQFANKLWDTGDWTWPSVVTGYELGGEIDSKWDQEQKDHGDDPKKFHVKPKLDNVVVHKSFDMSSPSMYEAMCNASMFDRVRIYHRRSGGGKTDSFKMTLLILQMRLVVVQAVKWEATDTGAINETLTLAHNGLELEYVPQRAKGDQDTINAAKGSWPMPPGSMEKSSGDPPKGSPAWDYFNAPKDEDSKDKDKTADLQAQIDKANKALKAQNSHRGTTTGTTRK